MIKIKMYNVLYYPNFTIVEIWNVRRFQKRVSKQIQTFTILYSRVKYGLYR